MAGSIQVAEGLSMGNGSPLFVIAGPCVVESEALTLEIAKSLKGMTKALGVGFAFKASFDKANRSSISSFRGPGLKEGLRILERVKAELGVAILTDIHEPWQAEPVSKVADVIQIPAFLCRQTDLVLKAANTGKPLNIKKGQFMAPSQMAGVLEKARQAGNGQVFVTERGTCFGYHDLVVDFRSLVILNKLGVPVVFDATHAVQTPGGEGERSGGRREFVAPLARAATAVGIDGLFFEVHPDPERAPSDGPNMVTLEAFHSILKDALKIKESLSVP
jgi:2-dehydro-3-deoxyphosphooctonate aldolase (KDO 8-P synthase)